MRAQTSVVPPHGCDRRGCCVALLDSLNCRRGDLGYLSERYLMHTDSLGLDSPAEDPPQRRRRGRPRARVMQHQAAVDNDSNPSGEPSAKKPNMGPASLRRKAPETSVLQRQKPIEASPGSIVVSPALASRSISKRFVLASLVSLLLLMPKCSSNTRLPTCSLTLSPLRLSQ
ncbi:uncharacterized protein MONBRDRAFT_10833 [Monosiga brevicollis MX1]|uniref:Uncharacterized protein n=1 Tax=Monosiga brevicollis TaxID=81824 RepID=A9V7D6_MONBE|nr:uncharacterized protein MONBRDRAFT_10833 [Monosiga brevicollis MX1]EDQ86496.1 predicted protein [Monosiga brevicollis MX1]|eukprot:XP_001748609.1 hypothetical protein [Monosiga brevicollis MX1]